MWVIGTGGIGYLGVRVEGDVLDEMYIKIRGNASVVRFSPLLMSFLAIAGGLFNPAMATCVQTEASAKIQGILRNERTRGPIPLGQIRLKGTSGSTIRTIQSDEFGRFSLSVPVPGRFHMEAERDGFHPKVTEAFSLPAGHVMSLEIHLAPAHEDTAGGWLEGTLFDEAAGTPVQGGTIRLIGQDGQLAVSAVSDQLGQFSLQTPGPDAYHLQVSALGYQAKESGGFSIPPGRVLTVEIYLGPDPLPLEMVEVVGDRRDLKATEQLILGKLLDYESGLPVAQGTVSLLRAHGSGMEQFDLVERVLAGDDGMFSFITPLPGTYRLQAERIGYRTTQSSDLYMMPGDSMVLDLHMSVDAVILDPITVRASARPWGNRYSLLGMQSFFDRQSRYGESGFGTFLTRDRIASAEGRLSTNMLLMNSAISVRALNNGGGVVLSRDCNPRYYLNDVEIIRGDGMHEPMMGEVPSTPRSNGLSLGALYPPETLEAVEVYVSPAVPAEFSEGYPCGVIALWTRRR